MKEAEYIQFSWFSNEFVNQDIEQFYRDLVGTDAETSQKNKSVSPAQPFLYQASGNHDGLNHLVRYDYQRLDWVVRKTIRVNQNPFESLIDVSSSLTDLIEKVAEIKFNDINDISRLALNIDLCKVTTERMDVNDFFAELCSLNFPASSSSDWTVRFNRVQKLVNLCDINRLTTYYVKNIERIRLNGNGNKLDEEDFFVLNMLLDYNTVQGCDLERDKHKEIWKALEKEVHEFIENPNVKDMG